ncbi:YdeI/OmpD-associated family protein [Chryseobacterium arthrosphaerae]|uniref:YdeI/OmpD-associated family protein n=1 Tax=Chryseobacterium arthrosphaerae TaxID=651561 RepID=UPI001F4AAA82|nr:YdeI/OmpD-associated family protein [Chryseobacterium arthrosphaerae]MDG4654821.1 YdeI/OmpD-associated family protein [Chryseobacterium arthrosphaerae]
MGKTAEKQTFHVSTKVEWRHWLEQNHHIEQSVWLICNTRKSNLPIVSWSELVDEALCFGWIDSTRKTVDEGSFMQLFSRRKPNSTWSKINKEKVQKLIDSNLMTKAGFETIRIAKENGSWNILDSVEELVIPEDLNEAFKMHDGSEAYFLSLSKSVKKMLLQWIVLAKRTETRKKRIDEIAILAAQNKKPKNF